MLGAQAQHGVEIGMDDMGRGEGLEGGPLAFPMLAQTVGDAAVVTRHRAVLEMGSEESEAPFQDRRGAGGTRAGQSRGGDAALGRPAGMEEFRLGPVDPAFQQARREAAGNSGRVGHLRDGEPQQLCRQKRGAEGGEEPRGVETPAVELPRRHAADAAGDFIADGDRGDEIAAAEAAGLGQREGGSDGRAAHMDDGFVMGIVELESLRQRAIGQGRAAGRCPVAAAQDLAGPARVQGQHRLAHRAAEGGAMPGQHQAEDVEDAQARVLDHRRRQVLVAEGGGPIGQALGIGLHHAGFRQGELGAEGRGREPP